MTSLKYYDLVFERIKRDTEEYIKNYGAVYSDAYFYAMQLVPKCEQWKLLVEDLDNWLCGYFGFPCTEEEEDLIDEKEREAREIENYFRSGPSFTLH